MTPTPEQREAEAARSERRREDRIAPLRVLYGKLPTDTPPEFAALLEKLRERTEETT